MIASIILTIGCTKDNKNNNSVNIPLISETKTYTQSGSTIVINAQTTIQTVKYCNGDSMVTYHDTESILSRQIPFILSGNTLKIFDDTLPVSDSEPNLIIFGYDIYTRQGTGSGLIGTWRLTSYSDSVVQGQLTSEEKATFDSSLQIVNWGISGDIFLIQFSASTMSTSLTINPYPIFAEAFKFSFDTLLYNISVSIGNAQTAILTGNSTKEIVTITCDSAGDETYSSSNANNTTTVAYNNTTCPPGWYIAFLKDNPNVNPPTSSTAKKSTAKTAKTIAHFRIKAIEKFFKNIGQNTEYKVIN